MKQIPIPIFKKDLRKISWEKIYEREYGVQYSEAAILILAKATHHFPKTSVIQTVIPGTNNNTTFYIDKTSWIKLVEGLNKKYTNNLKNLEMYEKQFLLDGENYIKAAKKINKLDLKNLTNKELILLYKEYQKKLFAYSVFAWSAFILNNSISDKAIKIIDSYITKNKRENDKQKIHNALFKPEKRAAILELQYQVAKHNGKLSKKDFEQLYERYKWLSCLDLHNAPWTKKEFQENIKSFTKSENNKKLQFEKIIKELNIAKKDLDYLLMAKRFVYIKDARDDYRRQGVFYALPLFAEIAKRLGINSFDISYLQEQEIIDFMSQNKNIKDLVTQRKKGFVMYLDKNKNVVCLEKDSINQAIIQFNLQKEEIKHQELTGRIASLGRVKGKAIIVKVVKDLKKVEIGNILVAVTTHPDYVSAMRRASAIITDEGGITSHAAIVSREFGIPCIVGTKYATKLIKNGAMIDVDAINGKITIL